MPEPTIFAVNSLPVDDFRYPIVSYTVDHRFINRIRGQPYIVSVPTKPEPAYEHIKA